jgi:PDZ domain-containing secreted protein
MSGGNGGGSSSDAGFDLNTKGQIHGYSTQNAAINVGTNDEVLTADSTASVGVSYKGVNDLLSQSFVLACSDETTALTTGQKIAFRIPYAFTLTAVRASLTTAGTGANLVTVDINESGTTILSTKITIDATEKTSTSAVTQPVISDTSLADDSEITVDVDQIDSGGVSAGLKVTLIGKIA